MYSVIVRMTFDLSSGSPAILALRLLSGSSPIVVRPLRPLRLLFIHFEHFGCCPIALQPLSGQSGHSSAVIRPFRPLSGRSGSCQLVMTIPEPSLVVAGPVQPVCSRVAALFSRHYPCVLLAFVLAAVRLCLTIVGHLRRTRFLHRLLHHGSSFPSLWALSGRSLFIFLASVLVVFRQHVNRFISHLCLTSPFCDRRHFRVSIFFLFLRRH